MGALTGGRWLASLVARRPENRFHVCARRPRSNQIRLTQGVGGFSSWSPDGHYIMFASGNGLEVMRADGSGATQLPIAVSGDMGFPDWLL